MADVQHSSLQHADVHEPRHITLNGTGASGRVITNSSSVAQTSEYRRLTQADLNEVDEIFSVLEIDSTSAQTHYWAVPFAGTIISWRAVVNVPLVTASNTHELRINGVTVTGTPITFASGGAAGEIQTATATGANTFAVGDNIEIVGTSIGNTDTNVDTRFIVTIRRA